MRWSDPVGAAVGLGICLAAASPAWAIAQVPGPIEIGPSWGRSAPAGGKARYPTIINHGGRAARLTGGRCAGFGDATLAGLDAATQGGSEDDRGLLIGPGSTAILSPNGAHLALGSASRTGTTLISCTLSFVQSGQRLVIFRLGKPGTAVLEP